MLLRPMERDDDRQSLPPLGARRIRQRLIEKIAASVRRCRSNADEHRSEEF
jgi:hypothetical protein